MKRDFKFNRLWMACVIAGTALTFTALTFTACSDDDEPTPDEPKTEDVYGNYTGTMTFKTEEEVANEANESRETEGIDVSATVKNDTVYFEDFPVRDLVASIVGEELADALVEAIGTVNYKVGYKAIWKCRPNLLNCPFRWMRRIRWLCLWKSVRRTKPFTNLRPKTLT